MPRKIGLAISLLLPGVIYQQTLTIELIKPTLRADKVFKMLYNGGELQEMYQDDVVPLSQQYIWINLLLERTITISRSEKGEILKKLNMYEALWDQSPRVRQIRAESEAEGRMKGIAEGRAEGIAQGEVQAFRRMLVNVVKMKFPALADLAQQESERINEPVALDVLIQQIIAADDENLARWLLQSVKK